MASTAFFLTVLTISSYYFHNPEYETRRHLCEEEESTTEEEQSDFLFNEIFTMKQLRSGYILLHVFGICYCFMGLAIICDDYFEPSLEALCTGLNLTTDVAGATFMAAGGSAPELATSFIGVFFAKSDVGFGTIVGSAVFNVLFVIAICAVVAPGLSLSWWPLTRDSLYYCCSILFLVMFVSDQKVQQWEAIVLFLLYFGYVFVMKKNEDLFNWMQDQLANEIRSPWRHRIRDFVETIFFRGVMMLVVIANFIIILVELVEGDNSTLSILNNVFSVLFWFEYGCKCVGYGFFSYWKDAWNAIDGILVYLIAVEWIVASTTRTGGLAAIRLVRFFRALRSLRIVRVFEHGHVHTESVATQTREKDFSKPYTGLGKKSRCLSSEVSSNNLVNGKPNVEIVRAYKGKANCKGIVPACPEYDDSNGGPEEISHLLQPEDHARPVSQSLNNEDGEGSDDSSEGPGSIWDFPDKPKDSFWFLVAWPLRFGFAFTIPDTTQEELEKYYPVSFASCVLWIGIISYFMVFMATTLGKVLAIPDPVMGLTLLAGGTSIPDLLSSAAVARKGHGDMAVSSSIGSNIFDILVGLPLPWILYTCIIYPNETIPIQSDGLIIMVLSLLLMVAFVCLAVHYYGWTLSIKLAYVFVFLYIIFVAESLLLEYGYLIPTSC